MHIMTHYAAAINKPAQLGRAAFISKRTTRSYNAALARHEQGEQLKRLKRELDDLKNSNVRTPAKPKAKLSNRLAQAAKKMGFKRRTANDINQGNKNPLIAAARRMGFKN